MSPHGLDPRSSDTHRPEHDLSARLHRLGLDDDGTTGPLAGSVTELAGRVRRRRRGRTVGASAAVASVAAVALVLVPGSPLAVQHRSEPRPASTAGVGVDGLCGLPLDPGYSAPGSAPLELTVDGERSTVRADDTWSADVTHGLRQGADPAGFAQPLTWDDTELVLVAKDGADAGTVVGVGRVPLAQAGRLDASDGVARAHYATGFVGCDGEPADPGQYTALVVDLVDPAKAAADDLTGVRGVERTSAGLPLTVRAAKSTPDGATRPAWLDGTALWCGMSDTELFRAMPDAVDVPLAVEALSGPAAAGDPAPQGLRLRNAGPDTVSATVGAHPVLAWLDAGTGKVVSFGADELASTRTLSVASGKTLDYMTTGYDTTDYCAPSADGTYATRIPPGLYDLVVYSRVPEGTLEGDTAFLYRPSFEVRVRNDGSVTSDLSSGDSEAAAALALTKSGHQPAWLRGSGLTCGMTADAYRAQSWPDPLATLSGLFSPKDGRTGSLLTAPSGRTVTVTTPGHLGLAWFTSTADGQPGRLVSFGAAPGAGHAIEVKGSVDRYGTVDTTDTCAPDAGGGYPQHLPEGDYWVALYTWVQAPGGAREWLTDSGEMGLTVSSEGLVVGR